MMKERCACAHGLRVTPPSRYRYAASARRESRDSEACRGCADVVGRDSDVGTRAWSHVTRT